MLLARFIQGDRGFGEGHDLIRDGSSLNLITGSEEDHHRVGAMQSLDR